MREVFVMVLRPSVCRLHKILRFDLPYDRIAQSFNPEMGLTDMWSDIDFYGEKRDYPAKKPLSIRPFRGGKKQARKQRLAS